jgi:hypothetical protein
MPLLHHRPTRRALLAAAGALGALALPAQAGAMTAISPLGNAAAPIHPVLSWNLAPGEQTDTVQISTSPATTPSGEFLTEHTVEFDLPAAAARSWAPTSPMLAGRYWWQATGHDADYNDVRTAPQAFHVDPVLAGRTLGLERFGSYSRDLMLTAHWKTNAPNVLVTFRVSRNGRTLWRRSARRTTYLALSGDSAYATWHNNRRKAKRGARVKVTMTISYGGRVATLSRTVKAP